MQDILLIGGMSSGKTTLADALLKSKKELNIGTSEKELANLQKRIEKSINHIAKKRIGLNNLIKSSKKGEENLLKLQNSLIKKAIQTKKELGGKLSEGEVATKRFEEL